MANIQFVDDPDELPVIETGNEDETWSDETNQDWEDGLITEDEGDLITQGRTV